MSDAARPSRLHSCSFDGCLNLATTRWRYDGVFYFTCRVKGAHQIGQVIDREKGVRFNDLLRVRAFGGRIPGCDVEGWPIEDGAAST